MVYNHGKAEGEDSPSGGVTDTCERTLISCLKSHCSSVTAHLGPCPGADAQMGMKACGRIKVRGR